MPGREIIRLAAACALSGAFAAGCGGPTKADLTSRAEPVCRAAAAELAKVRPTGGPGDIEGSVRYLRRIQGVAKKRLAALRPLEPPYELRSQYARFLRAQEAYVSHLRGLIAATRAGDATHARRLLDGLPAATARMTGAANEATLTACATWNLPR